MSSPAALREGYEHFDPRAYLRNNYLPPRADFSSEEFVVPWKLRCLAETFASGEGRAAGIPPKPRSGVGKLRHGAPAAPGSSSSRPPWFSRSPRSVWGPPDMSCLPPR